MEAERQIASLYSFQLQHCTYVWQELCNHELSKSRPIRGTVAPAQAEKGHLNCREKEVTITDRQHVPWGAAPPCFSF